MAETIIVALIGIYILRMAFFYFGARREISKPTPYIEPGKEIFVTIVVPARNEEARISECIRSIAQNDYPIDKYEIIAVNDRSEDKTGKLLESLKSEIPNLIVLHNDEKKKIANLQGKPGALQLAINRCHGDVIVMTDADCTVGKRWIYNHAGCYSNPNLGMVAAYTDIIGDNPFSKIQAVEWIYLHSLAIGSIGFNRPLSCYGNNISLSKEKFDLLGGYNSMKFSITEDLAMLQNMHSHGYTTRHLSNIESEIHTFANKTLRDYINQHHRWIVGAAGGLGVVAAIFVVTTLAIWSAIILSLATGNWIMFAISFLSRILLDLTAIIPALNRLKRRDLFGWIFPATLFMMSFELIAPLFLLKPNVKWKGQVFDKGED